MTSPLTSGPDQPETATPKSRLVVASLMGTTIEYYDFFLYGTAAALVFNTQFFPSDNAFISTLMAFSTFAVGFLTRPIGAAVFGHYGDRLGRKQTLVVALTLMGLSTFLIALLPTYGAVGVLAPVLLVLLRVVQGFAMGGEWGGAILLMTENVDPRRRGFWASFPQLGPPLGNLLAAGMLAIFSGVLSEEQFLSWGWRIPFAFSAILLIIGLWIRLKIGETKAFEQQQQANAGAVRKLPFTILMTKYRRELLIAAGFRVGSSAGYYVFAIYILQYATDVGGMETGLILVALLFNSVVEAFVVPFSGWLSDKVGRRPIFCAAAIVTVPYVFFMFAMVDGHHTAGVVVAVVFAGAIHGAFSGVEGAYFSELFDTEVRYSGIAIGFNIGAVLGGGLTPMIGVMLYAAFGTSHAISIYVSVLAMLTLVAALAAGETVQRSVTPPTRTRAVELT
ncbi:MFS transporter [Rhodococcus sp. NPDC057529]|uniref:MFS transporter n=1 Tax=Rhodococcus sp. NPDC057529 TaxID=3346158 RepID=UPI00366E866F